MSRAVVASLAVLAVCAFAPLGWIEAGAALAALGVAVYVLLSLPGLAVRLAVRAARSLRGGRAGRHPRVFVCDRTR